MIHYPLNMFSIEVSMLLCAVSRVSLKMSSINIFLPMYPSSFNYLISVNWMSEYYQVSFIIVLIYLCLIWIGRQLMKSRNPLNIKWFLFIWNLLLAAYSIIGTQSTLIEMIQLLHNKGIYYSICNNCSSVSPTSAYYAWLFVLSKVIELGDTAFIIFRKRPLIFLHWYHHCTVLLYTWYSYSEYVSTARWFVVMNYTIHSIMYTYYALKTLKINLPKVIPLTITSLQLSQMVIGICVNVFAYSMKINSIECHVSKRNLEIGFLIYASYALLFWKYYRSTYLLQKKQN